MSLHVMALILHRNALRPPIYLHSMSVLCVTETLGHQSHVTREVIRYPTEVFAIYVSLSILP